MFDFTIKIKIDSLHMILTCLHVVDYG